MTILEFILKCHSHESVFDPVVCGAGLLFVHAKGRQKYFKVNVGNQHSLSLRLHSLFRKKSVLLGEFVQLGQREDRAVLADVFFADIAAAALPDPAFHPHFQRRDNVFL